jgi:chemotaxis family two-component system response regulator Rcp1
MNILLVEDNPADARLTELALRDGKIRINLSIARDGMEAMAFLREFMLRRGAPTLYYSTLICPKKTDARCSGRLKVMR